MKPPYVGHYIVASPRVGTRLMLNGLPASRLDPSPNGQTYSGWVGDFGVPGENVAELEILDPGTDPLSSHASVRVTVDKVDVASLGWGAPLPPVTSKGHFELPDHVARPVHLDASPRPFPREVSPELLAPVIELREAIGAGRPDHLVDLYAFKYRELHRLSGGDERFSPAGAMRANEKAAGRWQVEPWDPDVLQWEPFLDGRVVSVRGPGASYAVVARSLDVKDRHFEKNLLLMHDGARWQILR